MSIETIERLLKESEWEKEFDERQQKEINFCCEYADSYNHGTDGHLVRGIVAKMAVLLDMLEDGLLPTKDGANYTTTISVGKVNEGVEVVNKIVGNTLYLKNGTFISFPGCASLAHEILENLMPALERSEGTD